MAYFMKCFQGNLTGMVRTNVDDLIVPGGNDFFKGKVRWHETLFKPKSRNIILFHLGKAILRKNVGLVRYIKQNFANNLRELSLDCTFATFRRRGHGLPWLTQTRPDLCASVGFSSPDIEWKFDRKAMKLTNNIIIKQKSILLEVYNIPILTNTHQHLWLSQFWAWLATTTSERSWVM